MHYNDQLHLLDSLVDSDEKLPDNTRVTFLESAVESVPDLRRVKITDNVLQAQLDSTRPISYRSYFDLLKDAAFHLDQATKRGNKIRRTNVHFSGPNDEDEHQTLSSDDPQVIQQEDISSEPPEPLSYSVFQSHFQGSSTSNTQKIFLPKPIWEKLSKDQQQMIIDHNRSLPKSGSSSLSTPNKSPRRAYIRHHWYSTKSKYFGPFYYIQIDPQDYDEWRTTPPEEEIHFSGPNDEDEHQTLSSDDNQVIQQENVCSEPPEPLSYSLFQSHFQGSSTSNTQKIFLPKPIWEKPSKDQQQMIIDHNRSLPKSESPHLSTPNKSSSLLPHKPTPQQTAKSQQVHTHQSDQSTADTTKVETTPSDPLLAMVHQSIHTSADDASDITKVLSAKRSRQIQSHQQSVGGPWCQWRPCWFRHASHLQNPPQDQHFRH